jgi:hypothetical protein
LPAVIDELDPAAPVPASDAVAPPALVEVLDPTVEGSDCDVGNSVVCGVVAWQLATKHIHPAKHQHRSLQRT